MAVFPAQLHALGDHPQARPQPWIPLVPRVTVTRVSQEVRNSHRMICLTRSKTLTRPTCASRAFGTRW
jgi:hypothetical protein